MAEMIQLGAELRGQQAGAALLATPFLQALLRAKKYDKKKAL